MARYVALMLIVEFSLRDSGAGSAGALTRSREQSPRLPIFVFARGGDERNAARSDQVGGQ